MLRSCSGQSFLTNDMISQGETSILGTRGRHLRRAVIVAYYVIVLVGGPAALAQTPINKMCPVMTLEEADPAITTEYRGKTVAFCCDRCLAKFKADPERYAKNLTGLGDAEIHGEGKADAEHEMHSHATGDDEPTDRTEPFLARIHPVVVHFPLAGTPIAMAALLAWFVSRRRLFAYADVPPLLLAAVSSIVGVITGNVAHDSMRFSAELHTYVEWHQYAATTLMILLLLLGALRLWRWRRLDGKWLGAYVAGLAAASALVVAVGFLGGSLVFGPGHLWP